MKNFFKDWTPFEKILTIIGLISSTILGIMNRSSFLSFISSYCNIFNAVLSSKGKIANYYFGIIGTLIYIYISFTERYYSEVITSSLIVMPITIYGLINWNRHRNDKGDSDVKIEKLDTKGILIPILSQIIMASPYYMMLKYFNNDLLIIQTLAMCITILAFYFMAKASPLSFIFFVLSSLTKVAMWINPLLHGDLSNLPLFISSLVFVIADTYGLINWDRMARQQEQ